MPGEGVRCRAMNAGKCYAGRRRRDGTCAVRVPAGCSAGQSDPD